MAPQRGVAVVVVLLALLGGTPAQATEAVPLVVAVDSSRSLRQGELAAAAHVLRPLLVGVPAGSPVGVVEFNDAPRWLVPLGGSPQRAVEALGQLVPSGRGTVLLDAVVMAARELPAGGVIVLVTDGRDEGSAATMSDVAALLAARQVRILALGTGHTVDARTLRRLAVLSGGQYLGLVGEVRPAALQAVFQQACLAVERALPPTPVPPPTPAPQVPPTPSRPLAEEKGTDWTLLGLAAVAVAALVLGVLAWRRKAAAERTCPDCGHPMATWETECAACKLERLGLRKAEQEAIAAPLPSR